jgi:hypothetical protein
MSSGLERRRLRVPVRFVDGVWECAFGGAVPVAQYSEAELVLDPGCITEKAFLKALDRPDKHKVLSAGARLRFALTIKWEAPPAKELQEHLIAYNDMRGALGSAILHPWNPANLYFVEAELAKPERPSKRGTDTADGGLWLITQGVRTTGMLSPSIVLPSGMPKPRATSLNHALTELSEAYEVWRLSHTGNAYLQVYYQAKTGLWHPLEMLRSAALNEQEHAIGGQLWDEFMKKMLARRAGTKRK